MHDRVPFLAAIAEAWDDPAPILVYADWLEERGEEGFDWLRWCAGEVMPAIERAAIPDEADAVYLGPVYAWRPAVRRDLKRLNEHPQAPSLYRLANVAMCRRPSAWNALPESARELIAVHRSFSLGLATWDDLLLADARERRALHDDCFAMYSPKAPDVAGGRDRSRDADGRQLAIEVLKSDRSRRWIVLPKFRDADANRFRGALYRLLPDVPPFAGDRPS